MPMQTFMKKIILIIIISILFCQQTFSKNLEIILYKDFLQKLMDKVFPINLSESRVPDFQKSNSNLLGYKLDINNPVLSIKPKYIQVDASVNFSSILGNQIFPARCRFVPIFNQAKNNIEFKVIEGKVNLEFNSNGEIINLGVVDLSPYISNIKIPLEIDNISIKDKTIRPRCSNVVFELLKDRVIVGGEMVVE